MIRTLVFSPMLFAAYCLSCAAAEPFPESDIQWILDQYQVSEPVSLIPAEGLTGWTWHDGKAITRAKWSVQNGKLVLDYSDRTGNLPGGDLVSTKQYTNFVLDFAWIATRGANSGIKYRLKDFGAAGARINYSNTFGWLGCEYQIVDDANNDEGRNDNGKRSAGSLYSVFVPDQEKKKLNPYGELNTGRIVVVNNHVEHWLNGEKVLQYEVGSETWKEAIAKSKYSGEGARAQAVGFGENPTGFIMLQDHQHTITFEKIVIREIGEKKESLQFPESDIQWILDQYQVSEPMSLIPPDGLSCWTWTNGRKIPQQAKWSVKDGKLILDRSNNTSDLPGGDIVTDKQYTNFVLDFAWIATQRCNNGIKYRLKNFPKVESSQVSGWLGCEYQILDDFNRGEGTRDDGRWSTASLYDLFGPDKEKKKLNPHGEVNTGRIVVLDNRIEHWLNGVKVLQLEVGNDAWKSAVARSKFAREANPGEGFGENPTGFIMLTDHGNTTTFEKIVIREIGEKKN